MQPSPIIFESYYVQAFTFEVQEGFDAESDVALQPEDLGFQMASDDRGPEGSPREAAFYVQLQLAQGARFAYEFSLVMVGFFRVHESVEDDETVMRMLDANAPALLYGAAREFLNATLGRGPHRPPFLPSVNFLNLQRDLGEAPDEAALTSGEADAKSIAPKPKRAVKSRAKKAEQQ